MVGRRVRAVAQFVASLGSLLFVSYLRKHADREPARHSSRWLSVGVASSVLYCWFYDRDVGGIRRNRGRSALATAVWTAASNRFVLGSETAAQNFSNGSLVGIVAYRLWYGLLRPVPDSDGE